MNKQAAVKVKDVEEVFEIAVIDDAFILILESNLSPEERAAFEALLLENEIQEELRSHGFDDDEIVAVSDKMLDALTDITKNLGLLYAGLLDGASDLAQRLEERRAMLAIVEAMRTVSSCKVYEIAPVGNVPDLRHCDMVFIDYYLEGTASSKGGELAERWAAQIQATKPTGKQQLLVLMSSLETVRDFRKGFMAKAEIDGGAFMFVGKADMDERWKVGAHLRSLAGALPHSAAVNEYVAAIGAEIEDSKTKFMEMLTQLDISDFAYIQNLSLQADGHPLGDYLSWLLSTHLGSLIFEGNLRSKQSAVDGIVFERLLMTPTAPTTDVAKLYHSAQFSRDVGALGKHPRDKTDTWIPLLQLGDVFLTEPKDRAVVVLSADCDLAFTPDDKGRAPDPDRSVILVEGQPVRINVAKKQADGGANISFVAGGEVYQIDWDFRGYKAVALDQVRQHLRKRKFETSQHDRLRPLYALKLQQEFASQILRIGPPVVPPVMRSVKGEIWQISPDAVTKVHVFGPDELIEISHKAQHSVVLTLGCATVIRRKVLALAEAVTAYKSSLTDENDPKQQKRGRLGGAHQEIRDLLGNDVHWETIVSSPVALPEPGKITKTNVFAIGRNADLSVVPTDTPRLVLNIID
ncbi:hypothetical protein F4695_004303 [Rhizobium soli]|uniref:Uncharacterized protein n=1 Tax=Rhizobium soli TaxID=424798 RepID=A0A7X0JQB3_9HYPH|nr:hypothetical protein [Rhizobium soli]MBB6510911.1 hypothetical protein [Rhizobium soli]